MTPFDRAIGRLLIAVTYVAGALLMVGVLLMVAGGISPLSGGPPLDLAALPGDLASLQPAGFLWLGLIVVIATSFFFALGRLPLADAIALSFISPVLTALMGGLLLGERLDWRIAVALCAGLVGMLLIVGGSLGSGHYNDDVLIGAAAVLVSAIGYSLNIIMLRHRATRDSLAHIVLFQNLGPALILAVPGLIVWITPTHTDLVLFALLGAIGVIAHTMLAHAFARLEAARLAPVQYLTLVWGVAFGFLFFAEIPGLATVLGMNFF